MTTGPIQENGLQQFPPAPENSDDSDDFAMIDLTVPHGRFGQAKNRSRDNLKRRNDETLNAGTFWMFRDDCPKTKISVKF